MSRTGWVATALAAALLLSNAWWATRLLDAGVTQTYMGVSLDEHRMALAQAIAVAEAAARAGATRDEVVAAAGRHAGASNRTFEKDGFLWIGQVGLRFDDAGRLVEMRRNWDPP